MQMPNESSTDTNTERVEYARAEVAREGRVESTTAATTQNVRMTTTRKSEGTIELRYAPQEPKAPTIDTSS